MLVFSETPSSCSWDSEEVLFMNDIQRKKIEEMRSKGCGYSEIAKALSISRDTIKTFCRRNNITVKRTDTPKDTSGTCPECGKALVQTPGRKQKRFCSPECRQKWWNAHQHQPGRKAVYEYVCPVCHTQFTAYGNNHRKYCSHECYVAARFKGGERRD